MVDAGVCSLKNSELSVEVLPPEGGRISSLKSLHSGMEFLTQSRRGGRYPKAGLDTRFQDGPCAGIEECLPTVGPSWSRDRGWRSARPRGFLAIAVEVAHPIRKKCKYGAGGITL